MKKFTSGALLSSKQYVKNFLKVIDKKTYVGVIPKDGGTLYPYSLVHKLGVDYFDEVPNLRYIKDGKTTPQFTLYDEQIDVINQILPEPYGILYSKPGTGKTIMALELIHRLNLCTLILVNTAFLLNQWKEVIKEKLQYECGVMGDGELFLKDITVATFQTFRKYVDVFANSFSFVIVDECHHIAADTFRYTLSNLESYWKLGLTGTYFRKDNLEFMADWYLGEKIIKNKVNRALSPEIVIINTEIKIPEGSFVDSLTELAVNEKLINLILELVEKAGDRYQLVLPFRLSTVELLKEKLPEAIVIIGATKSEDRTDLNNRLLKNNIIISTTLQEGVDIPRLDTLHLIHPNNNLPMLEQRINRICRNIPDKKVPLVIDYFFKNNKKSQYNVELQQLIRLNFYKQQGYKIYVI